MKKSNAIKELISWIWTIVLAFIIAFVIRTYIFELVDVPSGSMLNTIQLNDKFMVNKLAYRFGPIKRGDIVVFKYPDNPSTDFVKRVIGIGGDTIQIKNGILYLNGVPQQEPYLKEPMVGSFGPYKVPENHYFMMGDNRNDSLDSRFWKNKYVDHSAVIGKIVVRVYPFNSVGRIK